MIWAFVTHTFVQKWFDSYDLCEYWIIVCPRKEIYVLLLQILGFYVLLL